MRDDEHDAFHGDKAFDFCTKGKAELPHRVLEIEGPLRTVAKEEFRKFPKKFVDVGILGVCYVLRHEK